MTYLYIQVLENKFIIQVLDNSESREIFLPEKNFTTKRLLVGDFSAAQDCLSKAMKRLAPKKLFTRKELNSIVVPKMFKLDIVNQELLLYAIAGNKEKFGILNFKFG